MNKIKSKSKNCNCLSSEGDIAQKILEHLKEQNPDATIENGTFLNTGFSFDPGHEGQFSYSPFEYLLTPVKKDGTQGKPVRKTISMYHTYCPFCGRKYKK
jgi:hypothetical protein